MCQEVLEMVCKMDTTSLELQLALQCAPVITGIKVSNLLTIPREYENAFRGLLKKSHLQYFLMTYSNTKVTYLVFRYGELREYLEEKEIAEFLLREGYQTLSLGKILRRFHQRYDSYLKGESLIFPHEIGIILGYPVEDVKGFMEKGGKDYLYSGYWKVYADVPRKQKIFQAYEDAKEELIHLIAAKHSAQEIIGRYIA